MTSKAIVVAVLAWFSTPAFADSEGVPRSVYPVNVPWAATATLKRGVDLWANAEKGKALATFRDATRVAPRDSLAWHNLAVALQRSSKYEDSLDAFRHERFLSPTAPGAYNGMGECLLKLRRLEEAENAFVMAVVECPREWRYWDALARALRAQGKMDTARVAERNAAHLKPRHRPQFQGFETTRRDVLRAPLTQIPSYRRTYAQAY